MLSSDPQLGMRRGRFNRKQPTIIRAVSSLVLLCICCGVVYAFGSQEERTQAASATATASSRAAQGGSVVRTATSTLLPSLPSAAAGSQVITNATYGGSQDAFTIVYGTPSLQYRAPIFFDNLSNGDPLSNGTPIYICFCSATTGSDGQSHVTILSLYPSDPSQWSPQLAATLTQMFLPADAKYLKDVQTSDMGLKHVYVSADLAMTIPYADGSGIFSVDCDAALGSQCLFITGD